MISILSKTKKGVEKSDPSLLLSDTPLPPGCNWSDKVVAKGQPSLCDTAEPAVHFTQQQLLSIE